jgi:hypothetical protein
MWQVIGDDDDEGPSALQLQQHQARQRRKSTERRVTKPDETYDTTRQQVTSVSIAS